MDICPLLLRICTRTEGDGMTGPNTAPEGAQVSGLLPMGTHIHARYGP